MERVFGNLKMRWWAVILFAIVTGAYTGFIMLVDFLDDTSFQDIGIAYEWWLIFAVIIVVNCEKNWEAMLKCFIFFLISQPLVYAVEIVFGPLTFDKAVYYYSSIWLPMTFLTLPGGFIAYYCKKQNLFGAIILGLGNSIQGFLGLHYIVEAIHSFPHHILSVLVCFGSIFLMSTQIQKEKKYRIVSVLIPAVLVVILAVFLKMSGRVI